MEKWESLPGGMMCKTGGGAFPMSTDAMVLADFTAVKPGDRVCDLGCGGGTLGLLLLAREPGCHVTGVERSPEACAVALENLERNALEQQFTLIPGDLRQIRTLLPAGSFSRVISNPPYFDTASPTAPDRLRAAARSQDGCTLVQVCAAAAWLLPPGGSFSLVYRPEQLTELLCALRASRLEPKRLRTVCHRPGAAPSLVLAEARRNGRPGLRWEPTLLLHGADGQPTAEYRRIYHMEEGL